ncbi:MAG: protein-glutamate O-methyltransferase CheR [Candidatus Hydrogenedentes bacterium]|nr:protein-glutamate O-methyltransferase CheR [Candidatus Hydrogenedentota bacterium]
MDKVTFDKFRELVYEKSGISLSDKKQSLVRSRIAKRMRELGIDCYRAYLKHVKNDKTGRELVRLLDVISTNVTSFFREEQHFDLIGQLMREWVDAGQRRFRFWSAACSTGEEPYSLAMTLLDTVDGRRDVDMKILATDLSTRVLDKCRKASYSEEKLKTVPRAFKQRYFDIHHNGNDDISCEVKTVARNLVIFRRLNLSTPPFPMRGPLDLVLCRNVMIYFDTTVRKRLLADIHRLLKPGGYLMVGHSESLNGLVDNFKPVKPSVYIKCN